MSPFCGHCGAHQSHPSQFCTSCGATRDEATSSALPPQPSSPATDPLSPAVSGRNLSRGLLIGGGAAAAVLALICGVVVATVVLGGESNDVNDASGSAQRQVVQPVKEQPTEAWTWRSEAEYPSVSVEADGDLVVVSESLEGEGGVVRLDGDGEVTWRNSEAQYVSGIDGDAGLVYVATEYEDAGVAALDATTGEEEWRNDDWSFHSVLGDGRSLMMDWTDDYSEVIVADSAGTEVSRWEAERFEVTAQGLVVLEDDTLTLHSYDGEELWRVEADVDAEYVGLAVAQELIVVSGWDEVVGFDPADGSELWREELHFGEDVSISSAGGGLVVATLSGDSEEYVDGEVVFLGRDGIRERRSLDPDECCYYMTGFTQGGEDYYASESDGVVYDSELTPVAHFDGTIIAASEGFYEVRNGEVGYHELDGNERWARQIADAEDYVTVVPLDGRILVAADDTVTAYE